jgi:hypothetical protein
VLANFIARFPGVTKQVETTTGDFAPFCSNPTFEVAGCVLVGQNNVVTLNLDALTCSGTGALSCTMGTGVPGCCKDQNALMAADCKTTQQNLKPRCAVSGESSTVTTITVSATVPGFFTEDCSDRPGACLACFHCCNQAYGKDADAVTKCKQSFCDTQLIFNACVLRAARPGGGLTAVPRRLLESSLADAKRGASRPVPLQHPDLRQDLHCVRHGLSAAGAPASAVIEPIPVSVSVLFQTVQHTHFVDVY